MEIALAATELKNNAILWWHNNRITDLERKAKNQADQIVEQEDRLAQQEARQEEQAVQIAQLREDHEQLNNRVVQLTAVVSEVQGQNPAWYQRIRQIFNRVVGNNNQAQQV